MATNQVEDWHPAKPRWIEKAGTVEIDDKTAAALLAAKIGGDGLLPIVPDSWSVFQDISQSSTTVSLRRKGRHCG